MSFGKYTLFTAYGTTANANMSPLAYGIFFGNEDKANWSRFWAFVKRAHPILNMEGKTIITDQYKGFIAAVKEIIPLAAQFMCLYHCCANIIKKCGGGSGKKPLTCLWMFNLLSSCGTVRYVPKRSSLLVERSRRIIVPCSLVCDDIKCTNEWEVGIIRR
jgi:hypothetical protein